MKDFLKSAWDTWLIPVLVLGPLFFLLWHRLRRIGRTAERIYEKAMPMINEELEWALKKEHILTLPGIVITYRAGKDIHRMFADPENIESKLKEIYQANPSADFKKVQNALCIEIVSVQRHGEAPSASEDVDVGDIE